MKERETAVDPLSSESGFTLIGSLLVMVLVTALGSAAVFLGQLDLMLAGNYRVQRTAEASTDGALDLVKAMIYSNEQQLYLPLGITPPVPNPFPDAKTWAESWRAGEDADGDHIGDGVTYTDADIDVQYTIKYKQEDNKNYSAGDTYPDEVVRYGQDYNYQIQKVNGKQPVYTVNFTDNKTGIKAEADLISTIGFSTPAALFCGGGVHMENYRWATQESIEVTSGSGTPAVATASTNAGAITIETVRESTTFLGATKLAVATAAGATSITVSNSAPYVTTNFPASGQLMLGSSLVNYTSKTATQFLGCTGVPAAAVGTFVNVTSGSRTYNVIYSDSGSTGLSYAVNPSYLHQRVYRPSEVEASKVAGLYNQARDSVHHLLGVGDRNANLDAAYTAAGGGSGGAAAANALFRFYNRTEDSLSGGYDVPVAFNNTVTPHQCSGIVCYGYQMPTAQPPLTQLETMFGQSFADLKSLADQVFTCEEDTTLPNPLGTNNDTCDVSGATLGTDTAPQVVYFNGTGTSTPIRLYTSGGTQVSGSGILIIDGNAEIVGSINWRGLMLIRGNLVFRPWQGGTETNRSGRELETKWNGFIIIGGDLKLWTFWGGSIILGYSTAEVAAIKGIIASTVPHKVLAWRRMYN